MIARVSLVLLWTLSATCDSLTAAPGRMVDVGGRRLHLLCAGTGSPTIVFESGLGEGAYAWALVQDSVALHYRACSYDRSGIGFSDPDAAPRSVARLVNDLHELLSRADERGPYVLVGHSLGGIFVRRYAMTYPDEVAGLVLLDSVHEDGRRTAAPEIAEAQRKAIAARAEQLKTWHATGRFEEMAFHDKLPDKLVEVLTPRTATASWWDARFAENNLPDLQDDLTPEQRRLHGPIVVITALNWPTPRTYPPAAWKRHLETRMRLQKELATRSERSKHIFARTEHHIQFEDPQLVVQSIFALAKECRAPSRSRAPAARCAPAPHARSRPRPQ